MLDFDTKPPLTTADFLQDCGRLLSENDAADMRLALSDISRPERVSNRLLKNWIEFNRRFRNEIAWFRAIGANKEPAGYTRGDRYVEPFLVDKVIEASRASDPLAGEKVIDRTRWQKLDELALGHYFDLEFLITYGLKLKILERYEIVNSPKGQEMLKAYLDLELPEFERV